MLWSYKVTRFLGYTGGKRVWYKLLLLPCASSQDFSDAIYAL